MRPPHIALQIARIRFGPASSPRGRWFPCAQLEAIFMVLSSQNLVM